MGPIDATSPMQTLIVGVRRLGLSLRCGHLFDQLLGNADAAGRGRLATLRKHGRRDLLALDGHSHFPKQFARPVPQDFAFSRS